MAENDVTIQINLDAKDAQAALELFGKEGARVISQTEKSSQNFFNTFKGGAVKITSAVGVIVGAYRTLQDAINEAVADAKLTRQIEASLRATDEASQSAVESVLEFADAIKESTGVSDDLAKQTFIIAKSFGITAEEAKKLTKAAIDYAAATGTDVETAVRQLGGTLDGTIGKIGNLGAEFRNLTTEQLKAGGAVDLVAQKFGGSAAKELETYQGATNQLSNAFIDLLKTFGRIVTESSIVQSVLSGIADSVNSVNQALNAKQDTAANLERSLTIVAALGGNVQDAADAVLKSQERIALAGISVGKTSNEISTGLKGIIESEIGATKASSDFEDQLKSLIPFELPKKLELTGKALEDFNKKQKDLADEGAKFKASVLSGFGDEASKEAAKAQETLQKIIDLEAKGALTTKDSYDLRLKVAEDFNSKIINLAEERAKKEQDIIEKAAKEAKDLRDKQDAEFSKAAGLATGLTANALQGRQGAVSAVGTLAELGGQAFSIPGLGQVAQLLSAGPEQTKAMVKAFVEALPDIIQAISESIPVVVEVFVDTMVNKGGAFKIGIAIAKAMVLAPVWGSLAKQIFGKSGDEIRTSIVSGVKEYTDGAKDAAQQFFVNFFPTLGNLFTNLGKDIKKSFAEFPQKFKEASAQFLSNFKQSLYDFFKSFLPALQLFIAQLGPAIFEAIKTLVKTLIDALLTPFQKILEPLTAALNNVSNGVSRLIDPIERLIKALGGGGGGDGNKGIVGNVFTKIGKYIDERGGKVITEGLSKIEPIVNPVVAADYLTGKKKLKFAQGGIVPEYAANGFVAKGTDTVPAMLTPGEMVVPRDMVGELGAFLAGQNPSAGGSDQAILAAILAAVQAPMTVTAEAKVNQSAFADIILQLNRQNARLTA